MTLQGTVEEIIYCNESNGYLVCELKHEKGAITAVGYMPFVNAGETLKVTGRIVNHPDYGEQLKVERYEKIMPETVDALERYLGSGVIKGVGPVTAARIVERFGEDSFNIIQFNPQRLSEIKGISLDKAVRIGQAFDEQRGLRDVVMFFQDYGISPSFSSKIFRVFGEKTIEEVKANPYRLADEIFGIGFKTADKIARSIGIDAASKYRICSGIKYVLSQAAGAGHTYLPEDKLKEYTSQLLEIPIEDIGDPLVTLIMDKSLIVDRTETEERYYLSPYYHAEINVARRLIELGSSRFSQNMDKFNENIEEYQKREGISLAEDQINAVREAVTSGAVIITGGPGTGKTTIIKCIIELLKKEGFEIALAAPTGRAAKRMAEATGCETRTIHRLLEIGYLGEGNELVFSKNENNLLDAHVIIIDEMSMVDILLMNHLLKAIAAGSRLIMAGDVNQLPSVGAGNVLKDIISSGLVRTVRLTEIFRQAAASMIVVNAHRINKGEMPEINAREGDFFFMQRSGAENIVRTILELCKKRLPDTYGYDPIKDVQVLAPMRKGPLGVNSLNIELQKVLNPPGKGLGEKHFRDFIYRTGDRVMQVKNNYNVRWFKPDGPEYEGFGVFNGDTGVIKRVDEEEQKLTVVFEDDRTVDYDYVMLDELEPAFAVTIHKSQGSEFPAVIIPLYPGPQVLLTRNLLYTGITRAKDIVVLVGSEDVLSEMVRNDKETFRYSGLADKIRKGMTVIA